MTVGTLLAACRRRSVPLSQQTIVFAGAGSAGCGIAEQIITQMRTEGLSETQARNQVFMVDRAGLLVSSMASILDFQFSLSKDEGQIVDWSYEGEYPSLLETVRYAKPTILIGVSGQSGLFTQRIVETMLAACDSPIILPLSNPSKQIEATPEQLLTWTKGQAIIATGSPFQPVEYAGQSYIIPQCNNSYIFPGFGLAVVAAKIRHISDEMLVVASEVLAKASPSVSGNREMSLLPHLSDIAQLSKEIAFAVSQVAFEQGLAEFMTDDALTASIETQFWLPEYREYELILD